MAHTANTAKEPLVGSQLLKLKALVLISGAVLMGLEIIGSRLISPYFGNGIYVWGSLISVVMGALSLGYYLGGKIADRNPSPRLLGGILTVSGLLLIAMRVAAPVVCEVIWRTHFGTRFGAFASGLTLFFVPSVLMGMVSPFAVRLAARSVKDMGRTAGMLYALNSLGSILGTLITSFLLIDMLGVSTIVLSLGGALIVTAILCTDMIFGRSTLKAVVPASQGHMHIFAEAALDINPATLKVIVFFCGAVLMGLQISAARILSPYFGHGIYAWGSLISVFLAALSAGYYIGGRLADKKPELKVLGSIIALSCVLFLALRYVAPPIAGLISEAKLGEKFGTLSAAALLFLPPGVLLGMVSPFAVRLAARAVADVGKTSGNLYALSTLGSIVGTLITSFVLIDTLSADATVLLLGVVLLLTAVFAAERMPLKHGFSVPVVLGIFLLPVSILLPPPSASGIIDEGFKIVYETDSAYQHIVVTEGTLPGETRPRRDLKFDVYTESAIYLDDIDKNDPDPQAATAYTDLMHLPLIFDSAPRTMLMIGGGGGTLPRQFRKHYNCQVDVAEIDPKVVKVSEKYFYLQPDDKLHIYVSDGRMHLKQTDKKYDMILIDAFTGGSQIPFHLTTKEFFEEVKAHLAPGGTMAMNVIAALDGPKGMLYRSILKTWEAAGFENIYVFPKIYQLANERSARSYSVWRKNKHNLILVATTQKERLSPLDVEYRARQLYDNDVVKLNNSMFVFHARNVLLDEQSRDLDDVPVLTDDYAPVELMVGE